MIVKQANKSCKQEKDTEPKLPALSAKSCFLRVDQTLGERGTITFEFSLCFRGNMR